jgi:hypothetical protein
LIQVNHFRPAGRQAPLEEIGGDVMTTNESYYLVLVLGAFGTFAIAMALAMSQYRAWARSSARKPHAAE